MAPVMSSVTDAFTVKSPSARSPISFNNRKIASWLRLFSSSLRTARWRASLMKDQDKNTALSKAKSPKITANQPLKAPSFS